MATNGFDVHSFADAGTTSVCPDKIIPPPSTFPFPLTVENKLTLFFVSSKVLKDVAPTVFNFFSQYSINGIFEVPDTV